MASESGDTNIFSLTMLQQIIDHIENNLYEDLTPAAWELSSSDTPVIEPAFKKLSQKLFPDFTAFLPVLSGAVSQ